MKNKSSIHRLHRFPQIKGEGFFGFNLFNLCNLWIKKVFSLSGVASAMKVSVKSSGQGTEDRRQSVGGFAGYQCKNLGIFIVRGGVNRHDS